MTHPGDPRPVSNRKSGRKQWCRGKVGVEHQPECRGYVETKAIAHSLAYAFADWRLLVCITCGKELDTYIPPWPGHERINQQRRPAWVDK